MILITSGAYVDSEFSIELGKLPPAFLPVGNKKLYEHQLERLQESFKGESIYLSLPQDFKVDEIYKEQLQRFGVHVIEVPLNVDLSQSVLWCIESIGIFNETLRILHGDTLLDVFPKNRDMISLGRTNDDYTWQVESDEPEDPLVWAGFFAFSDVSLLKKELSAPTNNFVMAVNAYNKILPMVRVLSKDWLDFGHINTFYKARTTITTQRSFNNLKISDGTVVKTGTPSHKIISEGVWFKTLPPSLKKYAPQLISEGYDEKGLPFYEIEYICALPLNEVFVHGRNPPHFWDKIFAKCAKWFHESSSFPAGDVSTNFMTLRKSIVIDKTRKRVEEYFLKNPDDLLCDITLNELKLPPMQVIIDEMIARIIVSPILPGLIHGDLCFSNMIYDSRAESLKLIDPRAIDHEGRFMHKGDISYDLAKLTHSVIGLYDFIMSNTLRAERQGMTFKFDVRMDARILEIQKKFLAKSFLNGISTHDIMPQVILLFLSMLPLHQDDVIKQDTFLANAIRLYTIYFFKKA
jgi:hypothetical protein